jgi:hypothetical protein
MVTSLPIILIGPVLRRVEARLVSVFVALREKAKVERLDQPAAPATPAPAQ